MSNYLDELVDRTAPRWAWDIIDETLALDAKSHAFDKITHDDVGRALQAMIDACEDGE